MNPSEKHHTKYLCSAWLPKDYPNEDRPEVAMAGRSNAGKSSFLNAIFGKKLAKVSGTPGKTRSLNFFNFGEYYRWVDMPGYGFASRGKKEKEAWTQAIESYLSHRPNLCGLVLIMDARRDWSADEDLLVKWGAHFQKPVLVLLNKADKFSRSQGLRRKAQIEKQSGVPCLLVSASLKKGCEEAETYIYENWIAPYLGLDLNDDNEGEE